MFRKRLLPLYVAVAASALHPAFAQEQEPSDTDTEEEQISRPVVVEEVVVQGVRQTELNARDLEREKRAFSNVIAQDDAGDFADQNVAESLRRLPGITLQKSEGEGTTVGIRGLAPGFVSVSMNGSSLASAGGDTRAVSLNALPSDMLGSIEVNKVLTPDMDLNSIGGNVNVSTLSAFDKNKDSLKVKVQGYYQDYAEELSPKISLSGTNLLFEDTIGLGYSLSWEKRTTELYAIDTTDNEPRYLMSDPSDIDSARVLAPFRYEAKQENAERERLSGSFDFGWRPTANQKYEIKLSATTYDDLDLAMREYYRWGQASSSEVVYADPDTGLFGLVDTDLQQQYFIQDGTNSTNMFQFNGENIFDDLWILDYKFAYSKSKWEKPNGRRVQFRARDLAMLGIAGDGWARGEVVSRDVLEYLSGSPLSADNAAGTVGYGVAYIPDQAYQPNFSYDNLFIEDSFRDDEVTEFSVNLKKEFEDSMINYVKVGYNNKTRDRDRNKDRWSIVPDDFKFLGCAGDTTCLDWAGARLSQFDTFMPNHPDIQHEFITFDAAEELIRVTSPIARSTDPDRVGQDSVADDYVLSEDTEYAYAMVELELQDLGIVIAGLQYASTSFSSTGNLSIRNDRFEAKEDSTVLDIAIPMEGTTNEYDDILPHLHYIYDTDDNLVYRASLWTSYTRPSFNQARAFAEFDGRVSLCNSTIAVDPDDPYGDYRCSDDPSSIGADSVEDVAADFTVDPNNYISVGNPQLDAMYSTNLDASVSWYGNNGDLYLQAAFFYKRIKDFIVDINGAKTSLESLPVGIPVSLVDEFTFVPNEEYYISYTVNGDVADVYGLELSYSQFFNNGLFVQTNATGIHSSAKLDESLRVGDFRLPQQADLTFNFVAGWENNDFSVRFITNYVSKVLESIGACGVDAIQADIDNNTGADGTVYPIECKSWNDQYTDDVFSLDFKAEYNFNDDLSFYFDALNLTQEKDFVYSSGNQWSRGNMIYSSEDFGTSFQFGLNYKLM